MNTTLKIAIVGNGEAWDYGRVLKKYDVIIAADGGANHCFKYKITPHYIIGDGDSIKPGVKQYFTKMLQPTGVNPGVSRLDQDTTDLQKTLRFCKKIAGQKKYVVDLYSVTSNSRLDHTLAAMQALQNHAEINYIHTPHEKICCVREQLLLHEPIGTKISLVPVSRTVTVNLVGFEWSGENIKLDKNRSGISNNFMKKGARIKVEMGKVLVFVTV